MTDYTIAVVDDAINLLSILRDHPEGLSLAQITGIAGIIKNKTFRLLFTLEKRHIVRRDDNGRYFLGSGLIELGIHAQSQTVVLEVSRRVMDHLVVETGESIFLGVVSGSDAVCIATRESAHSVRLFAQVGRRAPLHSGGVPKILFAFMPDAERARLLDQFARSNELLPEDRLTLERRLAQIRLDGYAIVADELDQGAHSVAAPIYSQQGQVIAAISIAGPSSRFSTERIAWYVDLICDASGEISRSLGYQAAPNRQISSLAPGLF
ncbi:MAG: IclR family transcriptional regulator [Anaerolineae bacterium]